MAQISSQGSPAREVTVDDFISHVQDEIGEDPQPLAGDWEYSIGDDGAVEILFFNGLYVFSPTEFEELKAKMPKARWTPWAEESMETPEAVVARLLE